jgi:FtsP/CotA-like multicopper oxidase with cupredoxin domain
MKTMKNPHIGILPLAALLLTSAWLLRVQAEPLRPLISISSTNGKLQAELVITNIDTIINLHHVTGLRTYNGVFPGPTLRIHPGDTMNIRYFNRLQADTNHASSGEHGDAINNVNLHTHGLNVSPEGYSDNVYLDILPGQWVPFEFHIPTNHPTGLFWYHPHRHGGVSTQLGSGLAGNIIITGQGDLDEIPEIAATRSNIVELIFNEIPLMKLDGGHYRVANTPTLAFEAAAFIRPGSPPSPDPGLVIYTVNGTPVFEKDNQTDKISLPPTPEITMRPGEVRRFQLTHAGLDQFLNIVLEETNTVTQTATLAPLHLLSVDGITIPNLVSSTNAILLGDGNRVEFLVKAGLAGAKYLLKSTTNTVQVGPQPDIPLVMITVAGAPVNMNLPQKLNPPITRLPDIQDNEIVRYRHIGLDVELAKSRTALTFLVNGREFDPRIADQTMLLNTAEEWVISSESSIGLKWGHPFHIHVNWFQVVKSNGVPVVPPRWQDTVVVPQNGNVTIRHRFQQYTGRYVFHCHILPHEDLGMMQGVEVVDPKNLNSLQTWRLNNLFSFENYGRSADWAVDSQGIPNLFKYAYGRTNDFPVASVVQVAGRGYFGFRFNWQLQPEGLPNVARYFLAESTDLVTWRPIPSTDVQPPVDTKGVRSLFLRDNTPIGAASGQRFVMVRVQTEPTALPITPDLLK